jgi:hypothetical protein
MEMQALKNLLIITILFILFTGTALAQDNLSPYDIALQRIQEAEDNKREILILNGLGLQFLPRDLFQLTQLKTLYVADNQLEFLPPEIGQLRQLETLALHNNHLTTLPHEIIQLTSLEALSLDGNQFTNLTSEIGQLTNLCFLNLSNNNLRHLPTSLNNLTRLKHAPNCVSQSPGLFLNGNPLISPPPEVVEQGTAAVLAYLRNQAWYHLQRLIVSGAAGVGLLVAIVLGVRLRAQRRKPKRKRDVVEGEI